MLDFWGFLWFLSPFFPFIPRFFVSKSCDFFNNFDPKKCFISSFFSKKHKKAPWHWQKSQNKPKNFRSPATTFQRKYIKTDGNRREKIRESYLIFAHPLLLFRENTQKQTTIAVKKSKQALFFSLDCYYLCTKTRISQEFSPYYIYDRPQYHWTNYGRRQNRRGGFRFCSSAPTRGKPNRIMPVS